MEHEHFPALIELAKQKEIWQYMANDYSAPETILAELRSNMLKRATGEKYTFTVFDKMKHKVIGATSFLNISQQNRKLEIGWTWYDPAYWGTGYNTECKLLLLTYCFETLKTVRVQLVTSEDNLRSRKAIQKIGGKFEGINRKERIKADGTFRNTAIFSIIDDEWIEVKQMLQNMLA